MTSPIPMASMAPARGVLSLPGVGTLAVLGVGKISVEDDDHVFLSGGARNVTPGVRDVLCKAGGVGDIFSDGLRFPAENLSHDNLLDLLARKTAVLLDGLQLPETEGVHQLEKLRFDCKALVDELKEGRTAGGDIKLLGLHSRVSAVLTGFGPGASPTSLDDKMKTALRLSVSTMLNQLYPTIKNAGQKVEFTAMGAKMEQLQDADDISEHLKVAIEQTAALVDKMADMAVVPTNGGPMVSLGEILSISVVLHQMENQCSLLEKSLADGSIGNDVAVGMLLGIQSRVRVLLLGLRECFYGASGVDGMVAVPAILAGVLKRYLCFSMWQLEQRVAIYKSLP